MLDAFTVWLLVSRLVRE